MANIKSAKKRIRNSETKQERNKYQHKTARTVLKKVKESTSKKEAGELLDKATSMLDKLAKKGVIHKNKAANLKSKLTRKVNIIQ
ncbi:MAG: 30S ribosomal protein S20 [Flavobacteriales bacterium]|nr:30S ribosomal protein S20 [Flavobacteriales bacterium]